MNTLNEKISVCEIFNEEVLLYLNNELPVERMQLYRNHLILCANCNNKLKIIKELLNLSKGNTEEGISDYKLNLMIDNAISKKQNSTAKYFPYQYVFDNLFKTKIGRIAIAGLAAILILFFLLPSNGKVLKSDTINDSANFSKTDIPVEVSDMDSKIIFEDDKSWKAEISSINDAINRNLEPNLQSNF